jgi:hypothetical protein
MIINGNQRDWRPYARLLDRVLNGETQAAIAKEKGVSPQRISQMVILAKRQLAFRVFKGIARPLPPPSH